jgi:hypothetical protein
LKLKNSIILPALLLFVTAGTLAYQLFKMEKPPAKSSTSAADYDTYRYGSLNEKIIDIGTQPNSLSGPFLTETLFHDRVLKQQLAQEGWILRSHGYRNGKDMLPYANGRLDVMMLGDIPAILAMNNNNIGIFALCRQGYNSVISNRRLTPAELKGLRVGYPPGTAAHFTLERTLESAGLCMDDITPVPLQPDEMESELRNHHVDAVAVWEPFLATILKNIPGSISIATSDTFSYIAVDLDFANRHPVLLKNILASFVRITRWIKQDENNIRTGLIWVRDAAIRFQGESPILTSMKWISLLKGETIDNPSFPMIPMNSPDEQGIHHQQFSFLKKTGLLPENAEWKMIVGRISIKVLPEIIKNGQTWQIDRFDYTAENLYQEDGKQL